MKHLRIAIAGALAASASIVLMGAGASASTDNPNDASYWNDQGEHPATCYKHDPPGEDTAHGGLTEDGKGVVLNDFDEDWDTGDHWELLVVKSGSTGGDGNGNAIYQHPVAGEVYAPPLNNGGQAPTVSHWIVCTGESPDLDPTSVTWTATDGTCTSPDGMLAVEYDAEEAIYTGDPAGTYPNGTEVDGSFVAAEGFEITGDTGPFSHTFTIPEGDCVVDANPQSSIEPACGVATLTFSNPVDIPDGYTAESATFTYFVDGEEETIEIAPNESEDVKVEFDEDTGIHTVQIGDGEVVDVETDCDPDEVTPAAPTFADPTCENTDVELTVPADTEAVTYNVSGTAAPGGTVTVTAAAVDGFVLVGDSEWTWTYKTLDSLGCTAPAEPVSSIESDCGSAILTFSNPVGEYPAHVTPDDAVFSYTVDGVPEQIVVGPNESVDVPLTFDEDSGIHTVQIGDGTPVMVESNCELDEVTTVAPAFIDPTCDGQSADIDVPTVAGVTYQTTGDVEPGSSVTVTATALDGFVLVGDTEWMHDFPEIDEAPCEVPEEVEPEIEVVAFSQVCRSDVPFVEYDIQVSGTDATTATLTFRAFDGDIAAVHENMPLSGDVVYPGASESPQDWPGWMLNADGFWVPDEEDQDWREGLTVEVEVNPTASASVAYPPASAACLSPQIDPPEPPVVTIPTTTVGIGQSGPTVPAAQLPTTGSNATGGMVAMGALLLLAGVGLIGATRRRSNSTI